MVLMRQYNQNERFTPIKLQTLDNLLIGCKLTNNSINIIYDRGLTKFTETEIKDAVNLEIMPNIKKIIAEIERKI